MLQVCFQDSVKGALHFAQNCGDYHGGTVSVFSSRPLSRRERREALQQAQAEAAERARRAIPLEGRPDDILGLSLALSMGDILQPLEKDGPRYHLMRRWLAANPWGDAPDTGAEAARQLFDNCLKDLDALTRRAPAEPVRLWVDNTPDSQCGLRFAASVLADMDAAVTMVALPPWRVRPDGVVESFCGWGEVCPEDFGSFLPLETPLPQPALRMLSIQWRQLQEENTPLRAMVNGQLVSVGADFYDPLLLRVLAGRTCPVAQLLGEVLGRYQPGVGDWLLSCRIQALLESGRITMVQADPNRFYNCIIQGAS